MEYKFCLIIGGVTVEQWRVAKVIKDVKTK